MDIYLPIAEISANWLVLLGAGGVVGLLSGLFGVGGGFLITPLLIFLGVPAPVAVSSSANQVLGSSVSGVIAHWRRGNVDFAIGLVMVAGGLVGSGLGVWLFRYLREAGQIELVIGLCYVVLLGVIGALMLVEGAWSLVRRRKAPGRGARHHHTWMHGLPLKMRFRKSRLYISAILPFGLGMATGAMSSIMGVGGGFLLIPAMIYVLGMATSVVVGTSLFQIIFVTANITLLQAVNTHTVDVVLSMLLLVGGVVGAQVGTRLGVRLGGDQLRVLLALLVLAVAGEVALGLMRAPADLYFLTPIIS